MEIEYDWDKLRTPRNEHHKILIAEDDPGMQKLYGMLLGDQHELYIFGNGREAGNFYQGRNPELSLVITDFNMPGLTGDKLIQFIRAYEGLFQRPRKPILMCTADEVHDLSKVDYDRIMFKPFEIDRFEDTIETLLRGDLDGEGRAL
jgi:CheY-like chemotaxis protein